MKPRGTQGLPMKRLLAMASLALAACASAPTRPAADEPMLRLPPASLGRTLSLAQRLDVQAHDQRQTLEALLEADAQSVRLALLQFGRPVARLEWDGRQLTDERAPGVPPQLDAARILSELQLVQWPAEAIRAALPDGWRLDEQGEGAQRVRSLARQDREVLRVRYPAADVAELQHLRDGYTLRIESTPAGAP